MKKILLPFYLIALANAFGQSNAPQQDISNKTAHWFKHYDFNPASFRQPSLSFGPMARWWWPGNDVTNEELQREINLFADNGFAGVEIQPLVIGIPLMGEVRARVLSWDTPSYYDHLKTVMEEARKRNMMVDLTNGSGWPPGGAFLNPEDGFLSLEFGAVTINGGSNLVIPVPPVINKTTVPSKLQAVVASRLMNRAAGDSSQTEMLDGASTIVLSSFVKKDTLKYNFSAGKWKLIAFWAIPSGEQTNIAASPKQGPVVDHFDSLKVLKLYTHLLGDRTGLRPYFGNPMRAVFNDSYEFKANRHYSSDLISYFKKKRGYDITPLLPANMQKGYNFVSYLNPHAKPDFSFGKEDWRLRYDYDVTLGELLGEHFFKTSKNFLENRGLLHRTQGYGLNMDMIAMAGLASIPETESMLGAEANLKIMTSGAHLYNRPLVSAESVVFINRAYTTTPQKTRLAVDKLFAAGVNQVIYHGVPYRYTPEKLGPEGWYPFSTAFLTMINFSSNFGEGNIFWKDQKHLNEYVSRTQYVLRSGKPHADVLIYFPFLNVEGMPDNSEEIMTRGYVEGVEAPLPAVIEPTDPKTEWARKVYPVINQLEANGITWEWVNGASIAEAKLDKNGRINIRGNLYQALILANDSVIELNPAQQIKLLAAKGMKLLVTGALPARQPSFFDWKENDKKTAQYIATALKAKNSRYSKDGSDLNQWIKELIRPIKFNGNYSFTRQVQREMNDGSRIQFIWNKSDKWQTIDLALHKKYTSSYWMDADAGTITKNHGSKITYQIAPFRSVILYATAKSDIAESLLTAGPVLIDQSKEMVSINQWNIKADSVEIKESSLFDWKTNDQLKFSSAEAIYTASFQWDQGNAATRYFLDLGKVCFTAEVYLNGKFAGNRIYAPYQLDISKFLISGINKIEVRITPGQLNGYIGRAKNGDKRYAQFKGKEDQLMSGGLEGPVVIRVEK